MELSALLFMLLSWGIVTSLVVFTFSRILSGNGG
jgi:hypothetical protein